MTSRLIAAVAAVGLVAAGTARAVAPDPVPTSHPRDWIVAAVCTLLGLRIVAHTRRNAVGWVVLSMGLWSAISVGAIAWSAAHWPAWIGTWSAWPSYSLVPVAILIFPTGKLLSRRWWPVLAVAVTGILLPLVGIGWASWLAPASFWQDVVQGQDGVKRGTPLWLTLTGFGCFVASLIGAIVSLFLRMSRASGVARRLLVWAIACTTLMIPALVFDTLGMVSGAWAVVAAAFPIAALVAIIRYGLYDIDLLIHRTLLYGFLTLILTVIYVVVVLSATTYLLPAKAHVMGTIAVVVTLAPLLRKLRDLLDRWLYGDRADPYRALSRLGEQLANPLRPDEVFPAVAKSIREALKLPYVAISLDIDGESRQLAKDGLSGNRQPLRVPMEHGGTEVGELVVETRAPDERLTRRERRLLADLARQAAPVAQSARLAQELQRAGEQFDRERDEDLRRITRDLHDGIGPSLAGIRMQVSAIRKSFAEDAPIHEPLSRVIDDLRSISTEVRELVNNVRPRDLHHLGLLDAVRRRAERFGGPGLTVCVTADGTLEQLPAAVELAAYRIISEGLTNVARHARARSCQIHLRRNGELEVNIIDDGAGIPRDYAPGLGLASMRKRCLDLGGTFTVQSPLRGAHIVARLPLTGG